MALWGNNDNVGSAGTVSLNYGTGVVTGSGTSFGIDGGCSEGDVIRFGTRGSGNTYYGDAVIVSIANSESHDHPGLFQLLPYNFHKRSRLFRCSHFHIY